MTPEQIDEIGAWIDRQCDEQGAADDDTPCWDCGGVGCSTCDGSPLTDDEVDEQ